MHPANKNFLKVKDKTISRGIRTYTAIPWTIGDQICDGSIHVIICKPHKSCAHSFLHTVHLYNTGQGSMPFLPMLDAEMV
jgi:hypothetical protein